MKPVRQSRKNQIQLYLILFTCVLFSNSVFADVVVKKPDNLPAGFRFIGVYKLHSKKRIEKGVATAVIISPIVYRVYSDGIDVRVYCRTRDEDSYTTYLIYRSDGIGTAKANGDLEMVAGVQASSTQGGMMRQLSVTRNSLTLVKMPPRSHRVIVTRALAIPQAQEQQANSSTDTYSPVRP